MSVLFAAAMPDVSLRIPGAACSTIPPLLGHAVGITGDRRSAELRAYLEGLGATVLHGPMLRTRPIVDDDGSLRTVTEALVADPPQYVLATTGIGMRAWFNAAASWGLREQLLQTLRSATVLARGPKVLGALSEAGIAAWSVERTGQTAPMIDDLARLGCGGGHVALQVPGAEMPDAVARLRRLGARVTPVAVYDWTAPEDSGPSRQLLRAVIEGRLSAVTFTSRPAVRNFLELAAAEDLDGAVRRALQRRVLPVCVGPVTARELTVPTGATAAVPDDPLLGNLVEVLSHEVRARSHRHIRTSDGDDVVVQRRLVDGRGMAVTLSDREADVLGCLVDGPRRTATRSELLRAVWGAEAVAPSVLDTTIARLRRRLRPIGLDIMTVTSRGYVLSGEVASCGSDRIAAPIS